MTVTELHPDELLWREACGTLSPDERADLTAHLDRCPVCAMERVVRMEAARARVPSEADHAIAARLVDRVLAASQQRPVAALRPRWRGQVAVAAALVLFVAGTAIGATALVVRAREQRADRGSGVAARRLSFAGASSRREPGEVTPAPRVTLVDRPVESAAPAGPVPLSHAVSPSRDRRPGDSRRGSRRRRSSTLAYAAPGHQGATHRPEEPTPARPISPAPPVRPSQEEGAQSAPPSSSSPAPSSSPAVESPSPVADPRPYEAPALLRRAEQARTARRWADASRAFADLGRRYPGSREEIVGRALYGQVLLDQLGEPERALTMFERYLAADPSGALADEARLGRAQALQRLGRRHDERAAWLELLRGNPGSLHAAAARLRLHALDVP
jgi:TolA-binding protein